MPVIKDQKLHLNHHQLSKLFYIKDVSNFDKIIEYLDESANGSS